MHYKTISDAKTEFCAIERHYKVVCFWCIVKLFWIIAQWFIALSMLDEGVFIRLIDAVKSTP